MLEFVLNQSKEFYMKLWRKQAAHANKAAGRTHQGRIAKNAAARSEMKLPGWATLPDIWHKMCFNAGIESLPKIPKLELQQETIDEAEII